MKLSILTVANIINSKVIDANEAELKELFSILGFRLLEYSQSSKLAAERSMQFEIHYRRTFVIRAEVDESWTISFSNQFVDFGDGCSGVSCPIADVKALLLCTISFFMNQMRIQYENVIAWNEESEYEEKEMEALVNHINDLVFSDAA